MRKTFKTLLLALPLMMAAMSASAADGAVGRWKTIDDKTGKVKSIVEITQATNGTLTGKVVDILHSDKGPNPVCDGCEGANKNKPVKGMTILWNLKADGANAWSGGTIPGSGQRQDLQVQDEAADRRRQAGRVRLRGLHLPRPDLGPRVSPARVPAPVTRLRPGYCVLACDNPRFPWQQRPS